MVTVSNLFVCPNLRHRSTESNKSFGQLDVVPGGVIWPSVASVPQKYIFLGYKTVL